MPGKREANANTLQAPDPPTGNGHEDGREAALPGRFIVQGLGLWGTWRMFTREGVPSVETTAWGGR